MIELTGWGQAAEAVAGFVVVPGAFVITSVVYLAVLERIGLGTIVEHLWTSICLAVATLQVGIGMAIEHPETLVVPLLLWSPVLYDQ